MTKLRFKGKYVANVKKAVEKSQEKRWYVSHSRVMSYLNTIFMKFTSIFTDHKNFLNNSTLFDLLYLYKNNIYFVLVQNEILRN